MKQLIIDIGNTSIKTITCLNGVFHKLKRFESDKEFIESLRFDVDTLTIISSVRTKEFTKNIANLFSNVIILTAETNIPIENGYATPTTLGHDRLANAVAAFDAFPNQNNLIIDVGTCLKIDFINRQNVFMGGSISVGFSMRYNALHTFTDNLPLYKNETIETITGNDTKSSMLVGAYQGMLSEIKHFIQQYEHKYEELNIFLTGGDLSYFKNEELSQKNSIFADPLLTLKGLKVILDYNV